MTYILIAFLVAALAPIFLLAAKANARSEATLVGAELALELLEEVKLRRWDETSPFNRPAYPAYAPSALGTDAGENAADKKTFDDIDDFNGWTEAAPADPVMRPLDGVESYGRTVAVRYVTATLAFSAAPTEYKHVTVCAQKAGLTQTCLDWLSSNH